MSIVFNFSREQKFPYRLCWFDFIFCVIMTVAAGLYEGFTWYFVLFFTVCAIICIFFAMFIFSLTHHHVMVNDSGIFIETRSGRIVRKLLWNQVRTYAVTANKHNGDIYMCVSANANMDIKRKSNPGIVWTPYYDKTSIALPMSEELRALCNMYLKPYGIEPEYTVNPYVSWT